MKKRIINYFLLLSLFCAIAVLVFIAGCNPEQNIPIILSFLADPTTIMEGESSTLSWAISDTSVEVYWADIDNGIEIVDLNGETTVSPTKTTTYTLTVFHSMGHTTESVTVYVVKAAGSIDVNSTPAAAKVSLDGEDTGQVTPTILTNIEAGNHVVEIDLFGYKVWEDPAVAVIADQTTYLEPVLTPASLVTITIQPGPTDGKDALVSTYSPNTNYGNGVIIDVGNNDVAILRTFLEFDLDAHNYSVPVDAVVVDAELWLDLYSTPYEEEDIEVTLHRVMTKWEEDTITWNSQPDYSTEAEASQTLFVGEKGWIVWDIGDLFQDWVYGTIPNYGMVLKDTDETSNNTIGYFHSSEYPTDPNKRPKLVVSFYIP